MSPFASPLRAHRGSRHHHTACCWPIETGQRHLGHGSPAHRYESDRPCSITRRKFATNVLAATNFLTNFVLALALVQHLSRDRAFECAHRLYLVSRKVKIFLGKDP